MQWILAIFTVWLLPVFALAANTVTVSSDLTLILPNDNSQYTLKQYSQYDSMTVNSTTFDFTLSQGGRVTLLSGGRKNFTSDAATPAKATITCGSTQSSIDLSLDSPFTTTKVTVTPSGTCSSGGGGLASSGGGGGGGGGGGSISTPVVTTTQTSPTPTVPVQKSAVQQGAASNANIPAKNLSRGQRNNEVKKLQLLLSRDKQIYPEGVANGYFGPATARAVRRFQKKYGITLTGTVGPLTRKKLAEVFGAAPSSSAADTSSDTITRLQAQIADLQKQLTALLSTIPAPATPVPASVPAAKETVTPPVTPSLMPNISGYGTPVSGTK